MEHEDDNISENFCISLRGEEEREYIVVSKINNARKKILFSCLEFFYYNTHS